MILRLYVAVTLSCHAVVALIFVAFSIPSAHLDRINPARSHGQISTP